MRQYQHDFRRFISSISNMTGIDEEFINDYVKRKSLNSFFFDKPPEELTSKQAKKLELLKEFRIAYELETDRQAGFHLGSSKKSGSYFIDYFRAEENQTHLCVAFLNTSMNLIAVRRLEEKDFTALLKNKRKFIQSILDHNATTILLSRYNTSENHNMKDEEVNAIKALKIALNGIKADIVDYTVVNQDCSYFSYAEGGHIAEVNTSLDEISQVSYLKEVPISVPSQPGRQNPALPIHVNLLQSLSGLTGIKKEYLDQYFKENQTKNIFEVNQRGLTDKLKKRLSILKELNNAMPNVLGNEMMGEYILSSSQKASEYFKNYFPNIVDREYFLVAYLDKQERLIKTQSCFEGTINECPIYTREVVKEALECKASSVFLSHNHPGGTPKQSVADIDVTKKIIKALGAVDVEVRDHIIVCGKMTVSIRENFSEIFKDTNKNAFPNLSVVESSSNYSKEKYLVVWNDSIGNQKAKECHSRETANLFSKRLSPSTNKPELWKLSGEYWIKQDREGIVIDSRRRYVVIKQGKEAFVFINLGELPFMMFCI